MRLVFICFYVLVVFFLFLLVWYRLVFSWVFLDRFFLKNIHEKGPGWPVVFPLLFDAKESSEERSNDRDVRLAVTGVSFVGTSCPLLFRKRCCRPFLDLAACTFMCWIVLCLRFLC